MRKKNLIGKRYGKLVVIERVENNRYGHVCYKCKCDCGSITIVDSTNLRGKTTFSCGCIKSKGEMIINNWLKAHNINYQSQYSCDNIIYSSGRRPFFDFAIFNNRNELLCLIEYNGKQHYECGTGWNNEENFKKTTMRDKEKKNMCIRNNIKLYEIPYLELDNIDKVLEGIIKDTAKEPDLEEAQETSV